MEDKIQQLFQQEESEAETRWDELPLKWSDTDLGDSEIEVYIWAYNLMKIRFLCFFQGTDGD